MKFIELVKELENCKGYKKFKEEYNDAFLYVGFFILGDEGDKISIDFFIPSKNKLASFSYPFCEVVIHEEEAKNCEKLEDLNFSLDVMDLKNFVEEKKGKKYQKIIGVLNKDGWNLTCIAGLDILRMRIDAYSKEILEDKKNDLSDFIQIKKN